MNDVLKYTFKGTWARGIEQTGNISTGNLSTKVGVHTNLIGDKNITNPEELLLSAAASCYMITLSLLLENRGIPYIQIELESEAIVESDRGLRLDRIIHRPHIVLEEAYSKDSDKIIKLAHHAEHTCMVSSALRGNVEVVVHPRISIKEMTQNV
jgi:peroxiredoxin-like protein